MKQGGSGRIREDQGGMKPKETNQIVEKI